MTEGRPARVLLLFSRPGCESFFAEARAPFGQPRAGPPAAELIEKYQLEPLETPRH
jgi:hypothetical protein